VVDVNVDGCGERIMVPSLPDLIELLAKLAPVVSVSLGMSGIATGRE